MLGIYLSSVIIYMIIIYCMLSIFKYSIQEKGWHSSETAKVNKLTVFMLAAVPIVRVAVIMLIFYMATYTKEDFDKWQAEVKNKEN